MATPEALVKYYDCLRESFNKIQAKDNETALINAALRPKIRDELRKSASLLDSYLGYIEVFSLIYNDKFVTICSNILVPLFKESPTKLTWKGTSDDQQDMDEDCENSRKLHQAIRSTITKSSDLAKDFIHILLKVFPTIDQESTSKQPEFINYLSNFLETTLYLDEPQLHAVVATLIDKINPILIASEDTENYENSTAQGTLKLAYEIIYRHIDEHIDDQHGRNFIKSIVKVFANEYIAQPMLKDFYYLLLYLCSREEEYYSSLLQSLWDVFMDRSRSIEDRVASISFSGSFISRAVYIGLDETLQYLEKAAHWCHQNLVLKGDRMHTDIKVTNETVKAFFAVTCSIFYIVTQRFREMYEDETIYRLNKLDLDKLVASKFEPLNNCDIDTKRRFSEVATLFQITKVDRIPNKRRRSELATPSTRRIERPFEDCCLDLPERIKPIYRNYYDHRNFTVYRE